jgi:outer membrane PBP1 activator LpoA protein
MPLKPFFIAVKHEESENISILAAAAAAATNKQQHLQSVVNFLNQICRQLQNNDSNKKGIFKVQVKTKQNKNGVMKRKFLSPHFIIVSPRAHRFFCVRKIKA